MIPAVILCGGLGTRLKGVLDDRPKCLAPIAGRTYLDCLTDYLHHQRVEHFVFATGHRHEQVEGWLRSKPRPWRWNLSCEQTPLGTGGALRLAADKIPTGAFLALNGDTFLHVDCQELVDYHAKSQAPITLAAVPVEDTSAYGRIETENGLAIRFREKGVPGPGLINGGTYVVDKAWLNAYQREAFSLEKDLLIEVVGRASIYVTPGPFLDIGTPETLSQAEATAKIFEVLTNDAKIDHEKP